MKNILLIFLLISLSASSNYKLENICGVMMPRGGNQDWGIGGILITRDFKINLYSDIHESFWGTLKTTHSYLNLYDNKNKKLNIENSDRDWIGAYTFNVLKVMKSEQNGFYKVLMNTTESGLYICKDDLEGQGAKFYLYKELLFSKGLPGIKPNIKDQISIGVNLENSCLNLRKKPSIKSSKIKCILGNDWPKDFHTHLKILERKNNWAKVEATDYYYDAINDESGEGCPFIEKNKTIGWVKAIDENGFPNIWFSVSGY